MSTTAVTSHRPARLLLAALVLALVATLTPTSPAHAGTVTERRAEKLFVDLINDRRQQAGMNRLAVDADIRGYARRHCLRMIAIDGLFHDIPRYVVEVPGYATYWENVGRMERTPGKPWRYTVRQLHKAFLGSTSHRANILRQPLSHIGVGVRIANGEMWVSQNFAKKP